MNRLYRKGGPDHDNSLQAYVTKLYRNAGLKGASSHTGRRSFASRLIYRGATVEEVNLLLGHASIDDSLRYIEPSVAIMRRACNEVIWRGRLLMPAPPLSLLFQTGRVMRWRLQIASRR